MNRTGRDQDIDPRYLDAEEMYEDDHGVLALERENELPEASGAALREPAHPSLDDPAAGLAAGVGRVRQAPEGDWRTQVRSSRTGTFLVLLLVAAAVLGTLWLMNQKPDQATNADGTTSITLEEEGTGPAPQVGKPAQNFTATTVDGTPISLDELKGRPVWLTFGASWCQSCQTEMPDIQAAYDKAKDNGTTVVQVFISEDAATVKDYTDRIGITYSKIADPDTTIAAAYRVSAIPAQFFIDREGIIRQMQPGAMSPDSMDAALAAINQ